MNYKKLVPKDSFIGQYMEYMSVVETAESYDFWCAIWAMGVGCGRIVFVDRPNSPVFLNWYIILAAESGTTRKSTAINSIRKIVSKTCPIITGKTSPQNLELLLHQATISTGEASTALAISELVTILGKEGYMHTMPGLLTDLYDCPEERKSPGSVNSGELIQNNVYVNFLSASTPSWLVTAINPSVIEGGFTSRVMFIVDDARKKAIAWPKLREEGKENELQETFKRCYKSAKDIGSITISAGGLKKFTNWYTSRASHTDPFQASFEAREDDHLLRLACCLAINDETFEIQSKHISNASRIISTVKDGANHLFGGDFSVRARLTGAVTRVREILIEVANDSIKHSDLQRRVIRHVDAKELRMLMNIMHECGMVQIFEMKRGRMYRATKGIEKFGVTSEVLTKLNLSPN
jgi:hypothetical protein|tara:strand:- start:4053 stop:5279 length:1227 start_codon:yes stop_codon:yes gene_type:complete